LRKYSIETGKLVREIPSVHRGGGLSAMDFTSNSKFIVTVGND